MLLCLNQIFLLYAYVKPHKQVDAVLIVSEELYVAPHNLLMGNGVKLDKQSLTNEMVIGSLCHDLEEMLSCRASDEKSI